MASYPFLAIKPQGDRILEEKTDRDNYHLYGLLLIVLYNNLTCI